MTLATNNLYSQATRGPIPHVQPAEGPGSVGQVAFAAGTGTLPIGMPVNMSVSTGLYAQIAAGAAATGNDIYGIVWPAAITLNASGEVLGTVMLKGEVDFNHILQLRTEEAIVSANTSVQQLKDICRKPSNQTRGISFKNLDKIGTTTTGLA
jgi:hypothetical protein